MHATVIDVLYAWHDDKIDVTDESGRVYLVSLTPFNDWFVSACTAACALQGGEFSPLELLYLTRSADMWYGMLCGVDEQLGSIPAVQLPPVVGYTQEAYEPPPQLPALVRSASQRLAQVQSQLPPNWRRVNLRYPPYSLPRRDDDVGVSRDPDNRQDAYGDGDRGAVSSSQDASQRLSNGDVQAPEAAPDIYGPKSLPGWR
jgi:hypothetical protein